MLKAKALQESIRRLRVCNPYSQRTVDFNSSSAFNFLFFLGCLSFCDVLIFGVDFNFSSGFNFLFLVDCLGFCDGVGGFKDNIFLIFSVPVSLCLEGG